MAVRLVFLGRLEDLAGGPDRSAAPGPLAQVVATLDPALVTVLSQPRIRIAINGAVIADADGIVLVDGDEVAFLPPVSGG